MDWPSGLIEPRLALLLDYDRTGRVVRGLVGGPMHQDPGQLPSLGGGSQNASIHGRLGWKAAEAPLCRAVAHDRRAVADDPDAPSRHLLPGDIFQAYAATSRLAVLRGGTRR